MKRISRHLIQFMVLVAILTLTTCDSAVLTDIRQTIFTIGLTSPNGGEVIVPGIPVDISWSASYSAAVDIDLIKGGEFHSTVATGAPNAGTYVWTASLDHDQGNDFRIRLRSAGDEEYGDLSDAEFTISKLAVTSPSIGHVVGDGGDLDIGWATVLDLEPTITMYLYKGGLWERDIASDESNDGAFTWGLPGDLANGNDYTVRIEDTASGDTAVSDEFAVVHDITVVSPNGAEIVGSGNPVEIQWSPSYAGEVELELLDGGVPATTIVAAGTGGSHTWDVPRFAYGGAALTVRATLNALGTIADVSDAAFTILDPPTGVAATDGTLTTSIDISWDAVAEATSYYIFRSDGGPYAYHDQTTNVGYVDSGFSMPDPLPQRYTYYVRSYAGGVQSGDSFIDGGFRNRDFRYWATLGSSGSDPDQYDEPMDVAVALNPGNPGLSYVYVTDQANDRVVRRDVFMYTPVAFGSTGTGDGQFTDPWGIAADYGGSRVYVADGNRIQVFTLDGTFVEWWGRDLVQGTGVHGPGTASSPGTGSGDGQFNFVVDVDFDDNYVYTVEYNNHRVQRFGKDGTFHGWWGQDDIQGLGWHPPGSASAPEGGSVLGAMFNPWSIVAIGSGQLVVNDFNNFRMQKFTDAGVFVDVYDTRAYGFMDYDGEGHIYAMDGSRFTMYDLDFNNCGWFGTSGTGNGQFAGAYGIAVIPNYAPALANIYVADTGNDRMQIMWRYE